MSAIQKIILITIALSVFGCANQSTVENASSGTTRVFKYPYDKVKPAAIETMQGLNVDIKKTEPDGEGIRVIFSKSVSAFSWGEVGKVSVRPLDESSTLVVVDTEKRYQIQVTGTGEQEFSETIFGGIEEVLNREK